jgi:hypothetical protein
VRPYFSAVRGLISALAFFISYPVASQQWYDYHQNSQLTEGGSLNLADPTEPVSDAVQWADDYPLDVQAGQTAVVRSNGLEMSQVHSVQELQKDMKFDASINARYLFASAAGSVDLTSSYNMRNDSFVWVLSAYVDYGRFRIKLKTPHLDPDAQHLLDQNDFPDFKRQYGTGYIRTVRKGAFLSAVFSVVNLSEQQQQTLNAQFSANAAGSQAGGGGQVSNNQFFKSVMNYGAVNFKFFGTGGPGINQLSGIVKNIGDFDTIAKTIGDYIASIDSVAKAVPIAYEAVPYKVLGIKGVDVIPTKADQQFTDLMFNFFAAQARERQLEDIVDNVTTKYSYLDSPRIQYYQYARDQNKRYLETLRDDATQLKNTQHLDAVPDLPPLALGWPNPSVSAAMTQWHQNANNSNFTVLYVVVYNGVVGRIRLHKPDKSVVDFGLDTATQNELQGLKPVILQPFGSMQIIRQMNIDWTLPGHQSMQGALLEVLSPAGYPFASTTLGPAGGLATR